MLKVDREKLLNTKLNNGRSTIDWNGDPCIKCAFIDAAGLAPSNPIKLDNVIINNGLTSFYFDQLGVYDERLESSPFRQENPELCKILDQYEKDLMHEGSHKDLLQNFVSDLEGLVEWLN